MIERFEIDTEQWAVVSKGALQMVVNALRRDAEEGRAVRGEMADELLAAAPRPEAAQQSDQWTPSVSNYDRSIHSNPDAKAWADLFVQTFPGLADKHDLMLGWFANAMMAMHDHMVRRAAPRPVPTNSVYMCPDHGSGVYVGLPSYPSGCCFVCGKRPAEPATQRKWTGPGELERSGYIDSAEPDEGAV